MLKLIFGRIGAAILAIAAAIWWGARLLLDLIGYSTTTEDFEAIKQKLPAAAEWLLSTPWWVPALLASVLTIFLIWVSWPRGVAGPPQTATPPSPEAGESADVLLAKAKLTREQRRAKESSVLAEEAPSPVFLCPCQTAGEPHLSWWHIPIAVEPTSLAESAKIENCTAHLVRPDARPNTPAIRLQVRKVGVTEGVSEFTLLEGVTTLIPIASRDESVASKQCRITGTSWLVDGNDKFPLNPGQYFWNLQIRSGKKRWTSPNSYILKVPELSVSNGQFTLGVYTGDS